MVIGSLILALIGVLIGAIFLRAAAKWVAKIEVPFGTAYVTVFLSTLVSCIPLGFVLGIAVVTATQSKEAVNVLQVFMVPVGFVITAAIISRRIKVTFGRACLINLVMLALGIVIFGGVSVVIILAMHSLGFKYF
jgi:hypothetical protein